MIDCRQMLASSMENSNSAGYRRVQTELFLLDEEGNEKSDTAYGGLMAMMIYAVTRCPSPIMGVHMILNCANAVATTLAEMEVIEEEAKRKNGKDA